MPINSYQQRLAAIVLAAALLPGCYDADALLSQHSVVIDVTHLEEIDLGAFQVTLPHTLGDASDSVVDFHAFGQVDSGDRKQIARVLETRGAELRSRMLLAVRALAQGDFNEPKLTALRDHLADAINGALEAKLVKQIGFYHYDFNAM